MGGHRDEARPPDTRLRIQVVAVRVRSRLRIRNHEWAQHQVHPGAKPSGIVRSKPADRNLEAGIVGSVITTWPGDSTMDTMNPVAWSARTKDWPTRTVRAE